MGELYILPFDDVATGASANVWDTIAAAIVADTALKRIELVEIALGPADDAPLDLSAGVRIKRIADVSGGTAGTAGGTLTAAQMGRGRSDVADPPFTGKTGYTAEPTVYEGGTSVTNCLFQIGINTRSLVVIPVAPGLCIAQQDQHLGLLLAPRTAAAQRWSGHLVFSVS